MNSQQEARLLELQRRNTPLKPEEQKELNRLQQIMDDALNRGAKQAESGQTGTRGEMKRPGLKTGGYVKAADGCAQRGKTKGRMV
jgi:hypothetical protein